MAAQKAEFTQQYCNFTAHVLNEIAESESLFAMKAVSLDANG